MQLKSLPYLTSFVALVLCATIQDVINDLNAVQSAFVILNNAITSFPDNGGTLDQALAIHTDTTNARSALDQATTDAQTITPVPISEDDAHSILNLADVSVPFTVATLNATVNKKPAFVALDPTGSVTTLMLQDLQNLNASDTALAVAVVAISPADIIPQIAQLIDQCHQAFDLAIAAYES